MPAGRPYAIVAPGLNRKCIIGSWPPCQLFVRRGEPSSPDNVFSVHLLSAHCPASFFRQ
jgi:hypothetical protein